ncbi:hypothetical protein PHLCEN_2v77 [Hermanssonia centrifuga]|uniref:Formamidase n=1 Tax=Hermanssonia centrifuga TaxID=98765 RepID=A0A2R6S738_9APHY|nr:hypothetical protein PHLCEN_2v77 [Hermanssonia centrifuga]
MSIHSVKRSQCHLAWDNRYELSKTGRMSKHSKSDQYPTNASNGQVTPTSAAASLSTLDIATLDQVNGPVYLEGAIPGDTLMVEVLDIKTAEWGWTAILPGFGLLADEFPEPALKVWDLRDARKSDSGQGFAWFDKDKGIKIPVRPFAGEMGVAPGEKGKFSTIPPYKTGGNIDTKHLSKGATLFLPIEVEGALFSIGDGHAAQGDGGKHIPGFFKD